MKGREEKVRPIALMTSIEEVRVKEAPDNFMASTFFKKAHKNSSFNIYLSIFKNVYLKKEEDYDVTFVITNLMAVNPVPFILSQTLSSPEGMKIFLTYPSKIFGPFRRSLLLFDGKEYENSEFNSIRKAWNQEVADLMSRD